VVIAPPPSRKETLSENERKSTAGRGQVHHTHGTLSVSVSRNKQQATSNKPGTFSYFFSDGAARRRQQTAQGAGGSRVLCWIRGNSGGADQLKQGDIAERAQLEERLACVRLQTLPCLFILLRCHVNQSGLTSSTDDSPVGLWRQGWTSGMLDAGTHWRHKPTSPRVDKINEDRNPARDGHTGVAWGALHLDPPRTYTHADRATGKGQASVD